MSARTLLNAVTSTGAGSPLGPFRYLVKDHVVQVALTGAPTSAVIDIEGSLDGTNFVQIGQFDAATSLIGFAIDKPVMYVRLNLTTLTGGSSPTVTALYEGDKLIGYPPHGVF